MIKHMAFNCNSQVGFIWINCMLSKFLVLFEFTCLNNTIRTQDASLLVFRKIKAIILKF